MTLSSRNTTSKSSPQEKSVLATLLGFVLMTSGVLLLAITVMEMFFVAPTINVVLYFVASFVAYKLGRFVLFKCATRPLLSQRERKNGRRRSRYYSAI